MPTGQDGSLRGVAFVSFASKDVMLMIDGSQDRLSTNDNGSLTDIGIDMFLYWDWASGGHEGSLATGW